MVSSSHAAVFALLAFLLIIVPGPNVLFVISRSLTLGRTAGVCTALGGQIGVFTQVVAVAFGIGALVESSVAIFTAIKLAGAAYLVYLGIQAVRHRGALGAALDAPPQRKALRSVVRDGVLVGVSNPKSIVFFTAVLPQFVDRSAGDVPVQMLELGAIFVVIAVLCDSLWALAAGTARAWLARSPRRLAVLGGSSGLMLIGLGAGLALTGRKD